MIIISINKSGEMKRFGDRMPIPHELQQEYGAVAARSSGRVQLSRGRSPAVRPAVGQTAKAAHAHRPSLL